MGDCSNCNPGKGLILIGMEAGCLGGDDGEFDELSFRVFCGLQA